MTGCCGGMGQSEEPRKPEGQCHGMGIPAKEVIGKVKEAIEKFRATLLCPVHNIQGVPALTGPEADEATDRRLRGHGSACVTTWGSLVDPFLV